MTAESPPVALAARPRKIRSPLTELTLARLREFIREPGAVFWTFGFPILITIALGVAFRNQGPPQVDIGVLAGPEAQADADALTKTGRLVPRVVSQDEAGKLLRSGKIAVLVVPGEHGAVTYRFDPSRPEAFGARLLADDALQRAAGRADTRTATDEKVSAPGARYVDWLVPGLLGMQLMSGSLWGIAWTIVQTRQRKLLKRLVATPMKRTHYLMAFMLSRFLALAVEVPVLMGFAYFAFGVEIRGSILGMCLVSALGAASFAGVGLLCASRAQNSETANGLVNLVTLPMFVLSGVFFSAQRFPEFLQPVIRVLPLTALNEALRAIVNDGVSMANLGFQLAVMGVWALVSFAIALRIFRWT
ncbi:MAG: ABC transporter permease [Deltaproteobacteria bacterium]|nr:ABC transporter permease [Deltaproteobacteria bacterium]